MANVEDNYENETICIKFCGVCPSYPGVRENCCFAPGGRAALQSRNQAATAACAIYGTNTTYQIFITA